MPLFPVIAHRYPHIASCQSLLGTVLLFPYRNSYLSSLSPAAAHVVPSTLVHETLLYSLYLCRQLTRVFTVRAYWASHCTTPPSAVCVCVCVCCYVCPAGPHIYWIMLDGSEVSFRRDFWAVTRCRMSTYVLVPSILST